MFVCIHTYRTTKLRGGILVRIHFIPMLMVASSIQGNSVWSFSMNQNCSLFRVRKSGSRLNFSVNFTNHLHIRAMAQNNALPQSDNKRQSVAIVHAQPVLAAYKSANTLTMFPPCNLLYGKMRYTHDHYKTEILPYYTYAERSHTVLLRPV